MTSNMYMSARVLWLVALLQSSEQQSARLQMASHRHTLTLNEGLLDCALTDLVTDVLTSRSLAMEPDITPQAED